ncbi:MAG: J domain-containing protein [Acidobacteria bacterium]|nr:J domain-containing protein [Acidobacteriota bacterium]
MDSELTLSNAADQKRIEELREDLAALEAAIAGREIELADLEKGMRIFEGRYLPVVGNKYDQLAEIEKQIAELQGLPFDEDVVDASLAEDEVGCGQNRMHSDRLKKLYREVARKFHPDLTSCEHERRHRHQLMVEVNRAYETGAEDRLQNLLDAGAAHDEVTDARVMSAEMILLLRKVAEARQRLVGIEADLADITGSEIYKLKLRVENADSMGVDLMAELVSQVDRQIRKSLNRLEHLRAMEIA